jgi:lipid-binding SYLF domain-containing protein
MKITTLKAATGFMILGLFASTATFAHSKAELNTSANKTLTKFYALSPMNKELADKAAGVLIFSGVTKAGAGVAGEYGEGVLRLNGSTVNYYSVGSASVGLTLGVSKHSEIIMFMTRDALDKFMNSEDWSIGADTAVALVSSGAAGQYDSGTLDKPILGFVFAEKGLIGDLSLEGSKISKIKTTA